MQRLYQIGCNFGDASVCTYYQEHAPRSATKPYQDNFAHEDSLFVVIPGNGEGNTDWAAFFARIEGFWKEKQPNAAVARLQYDEVCVACAALRAKHHILIDTSLAESSRWLPIFLRQLQNMQDTARAGTLTHENVDRIQDVSRVHLVSNAPDRIQQYDLLVKFGMKLTNYKDGDKIDFDRIREDMLSQTSSGTQIVYVKIADLRLPGIIDPLQSAALEPLIPRVELDFGDELLEDAEYPSPTGDVIDMIAPDSPLELPTPTDEAADDPLTHFDLTDLAPLASEPTPVQEVDADRREVEPPPDTASASPDRSDESDVLEELTKDRSSRRGNPFSKPVKDIDALDIEIDLGGTYLDPVNVRTRLMSRYPILSYFGETLKDERYTPILNDFNTPIAKAHQKLIEGEFFDAYALFGEADNAVFEGRMRDYLLLIRQVCVQNFNVPDAVRAFFNLEEVRAEIVIKETNATTNGLRPTTSHGITDKDIYEGEIRLENNRVHRALEKDSVIPLYIYKRFESSDINFVVSRAARSGSFDNHRWVMVITNDPASAPDLLERKIEQREEQHPPIHIVEFNKRDLIHCILHPSHARFLFEESIGQSYEKLEAKPGPFTLDDKDHYAHISFGYDDIIAQIQDLIDRDRDFMLIDPLEIGTHLCVDELMYRNGNFLSGEVAQSIIARIDLSAAEGENAVYSTALNQIIAGIDAYFRRHIYSVSKMSQIRDIVQETEGSDPATRFKATMDIGEIIAESQDVGAKRLVLIFENLDAIIDHLSAESVAEFLNLVRRLTAGNTYLTIGMLSNATLLMNSSRPILEQLNEVERIIIPPITEEVTGHILNHMAYNNWLWFEPNLQAELYNLLGGHVGLLFDFANRIYAEFPPQRLSVSDVPRTRRDSILTEILATHRINGILSDYFRLMPVDADIVRILSTIKFLGVMAEDDLWEEFKASDNPGLTRYRAQFSAAIQRLEYFGFVKYIAAEGGYSLGTDLLQRWARNNLLAPRGA
jgi:hypothetical protein